jgi:HlyD family secretion protein
LVFLLKNYVLDRELSNKVKRKKNSRKLIQVGIWIGLFLAVIISLRFVIRPSIRIDEFDTDFITIGNIEASITASGTALPEFEEIKISPVNSRIITIYHNTGDKVGIGDSILALDKTILVSDYEKLNDELNIKKNKVNQRRLQLEKNLIDIKTNYEIKKLQVENMATELEEEKYLNKIGGGTKERLEKADLNLTIARLELEQIKQNIENLEESMKADILGLNYEINIQHKNMIELQDKINQATITTDKDGVITWINAQIGKNVNAGEELVKIANLKSYEVTGSISDMHAEKLNIGQLVIVRLNEDTEIRGEIINISPTVTSNVIQFKIKLYDKAHTLLRPNLKVDVFVITSFKENVTCSKNGAFYKGATKQYVFVKQENKLIRKEVEFGESNFYFVEIINGLKDGDEIVLTDMTDYERHQELTIKN